MEITKLTSEEYRQQAAECSQRREKSFQNCDTDGFLSQWASGLHSSLYSRLAELAENNWTAEFPALFYKDTNERVPAKIISVPDKFSYNGVMKSLWAIIDPTTGKFTGQFLPTGKNSRKQKSAGFYEGTEIAPAYAKIDGRGRGLSGSAWVAVYRTDAGYPESVLNIDPKTTKEGALSEIREYCTKNLSDSPYGVIEENSTSRSGKPYTKIICGKPGVDVILDVYGPKFVLVKISGQHQNTVCNSVEEVFAALNTKFGF
jgi:hypothetical protein